MRHRSGRSRDSLLPKDGTIRADHRLEQVDGSLLIGRVCNFRWVLKVGHSFHEARNQSPRVCVLRVYRCIDKLFDGGEQICAGASRGGRIHSVGRLEIIGCTRAEHCKRLRVPLGESLANLSLGAGEIQLHRLGHSHVEEGLGGRSKVINNDCPHSTGTGRRQERFVILEKTEFTHVHVGRRDLKLVSQRHVLIVPP